MENSNKTFKVIITGTKAFRNYIILREKLEDFFHNRRDIELVVKNKAPLQKLISAYVLEKNYKLTTFDTSKKQPSKKKRDEEMVEYANACIAFWDGESKGTARILELAEKKGISTAVVRIKPEFLAI